MPWASACVRLVTSISYDQCWIFIHIDIGCTAIWFNLLVPMQTNRSSFARFSGSDSPSLSWSKNSLASTGFYWSSPHQYESTLNIISLSLAVHTSLSRSSCESASKSARSVWGSPLLVKYSIANVGGGQGKPAHSRAPIIKSKINLVSNP